MFELDKLIETYEEMVNETNEARQRAGARAALADGFRFSLPSSTNCNPTRSCRRCTEPSTTGTPTRCGDCWPRTWCGTSPATIRWPARTEVATRCGAEEGHGAWVRERFIDLFGIDPSAGLPPLPEKLWDYVDPEAGGDER